MNIFRDIKFVARLFIKYPGSSLLGIVVLGLGLGLSITAFALINGIVWSSPGVKDGQRLLHMQWIRDQSSKNFKPFFRGIEVKAIQQQLQSFDATVFYQIRTPAVHRQNSDVPILRQECADVGPDFFEFWQVNPIIGRLLVEADMRYGTERVAIISYELWQTHFTGLPNAIGKLLQLNSQPYKVVGVMPEHFHLPSKTQVWTAKRAWAGEKRRVYHMIGVLKFDQTVAQAEDELNQIVGRLVREDPKTLQGRSGIRVEPFNTNQFSSGLKTILLFFSATALLVFIVACANISSLLMIRISNRQQELVVRKTLGAGRMHIVMQVMLEGLLFALGGLVVGFQLYALASGPIWTWLQNNFSSMPYWWHMRADGTVYLFATVVVLLSTIISSLIPALRAVSKQADRILKDESHMGSGLFVGRIAKALVAIQIMCATVLSVMALTALFVTDYLSDWDLSYQATQILTSRYRLGYAAGFKTDAELFQFYDKVVDVLQASPGIDSVGFASSEGGVARSVRRFEIEEKQTRSPLQERYASANIVTKGYFSVFDMQALQGRLLLATDTMAVEKVANVNQHFVDAYFGDESPLGQRVRVHRPGLLYGITNDISPLTEWMTIVGVVSNIQRSLLPGESTADLAEIYIPAMQRPERELALLLKADGDVMRWAEPMRRAVSQQVQLAVPIRPFETVSQVLENGIKQQTTLTLIVMVFGGLALFIATVGLYGLISFTTILRRREFGIRFALGADNLKIFVLVFERTAWLSGVGLVSGMGVAASINNTLKHGLGGVDFPVEVPSYFIGISLVVIISLIAVIVPTIQAIRIPPIEALRAD